MPYFRTIGIEFSRNTKGCFDAIRIYDSERGTICVTGDYEYAQKILLSAYEKAVSDCLSENESIVNSKEVTKK